MRCAVGAQREQSGPQPSGRESPGAQEELPIIYHGAALRVGFNARYLLDALNSLDGDEVEVALGDAQSSALLTLPGRQDFKYVVMPMRLD
ncbi:hypothetical protein DWG20_12085 [Crenobacter cavernae]|uniref:Beta sliding clamp n=1 Tax=Crenobacter cavernae TaxID=2290923 RepID=A0A345Y873_9NEIS|nr:hypothetical protein DWG20_12085 [Crenobacter cavernae]